MKDLERSIILEKLSKCNQFEVEALMEELSQYDERHAKKERRVKGKD